MTYSTLLESVVASHFIVVIRPLPLQKALIHQLTFYLMYIDLFITIYYFLARAFWAIIPYERSGQTALHEQKDKP